LADSLDALGSKTDEDDDSSEGEVVEAAKKSNECR